MRVTYLAWVRLYFSATRSVARPRGPAPKSGEFGPPNVLSLSRSRPSHSGSATRSVAQNEARKRRASERPRVGCCEELGGATRAPVPNMFHRRLETEMTKCWRASIARGPRREWPANRAVVFAHHVAARASL